MDVAHGILFFFIGTTLTVVGFSIAFYFANKVYEEANKKREPSPLDDILGHTKDDCQ